MQVRDALLELMSSNARAEKPIADRRTRAWDLKTVAPPALAPSTPPAAKEATEPFTVADSIEKILVTGGTGFVGGAVLAELFESKFWAQTLIMARGAGPADARSRIVKSLKRFLPETDVGAFISDDQIIACSLEDVDQLLDDDRIRGVSHVVHSAAITAFSNHPRIRAINVDASLRFVSVLKQRARIQRFINVGTAWCVGMDVEKLVAEDGEQGSATHIVPYTQSKLEFEKSVRRLHPDFPFVSARPSIVVGHTRLGTAPSGSIYWVFRSVQVLGQFTTKFQDRMDVVPVDWVAQALVGLMTKRELFYDTYHLSSGVQSCSTIEQLDTAIADGRNVEPHGALGYKSVNDRQLTMAVYAKRKMLGDANPWLLSKALGLYARFAESGVVFDNRRTLAEGIGLPPPFHTYANICAKTSENSSFASQMEDDFK